MRALDDAVRAGKVLYVGISDAPAWVVARANTLAEWRGWASFVGLQVPYNLLNRDIERELLPMARGFGMSVAAWSPLAGGILSGKYSAGASPDGARLDAAALGEREHAVARAVAEVAAEIGASPSQVALAWVRQAAPGVHPIVGARRLEQVVDNLGSVDVTLPADAVTRLMSAAPFQLGFPHDFIAETEPWVYGAANTRLTSR
jgi:aryl-alcohol dehydrogenase-like predicted oxidoreductase